VHCSHTVHSGTVHTGICSREVLFTHGYCSHEVLSMCMYCSHEQCLMTWTASQAGKIVCHYIGRYMLTCGGAKLSVFNLFEWTLCTECSRLKGDPDPRWRRQS
jgi:hypothetical protein